jgi:hypothetical protein
VALKDGKYIVCCAVLSMGKAPMRPTPILCRGLVVWNGVSQTHHARPRTCSTLGGVVDACYDGFNQDATCGFFFDSAGNKIVDSQV